MNEYCMKIEQLSDFEGSAWAFLLEQIHEQVFQRHSQEHMLSE